jgi:hypothetical protein
MNSFVYDFYSKTSDIEGGAAPFNEVILVDDNSKLAWEKLIEIAPNFPRGWYELCCLSTSDRIEFTHDFWKSIIPYVPHIDSFLSSFFSNLDDVAVFLVKNLPDDPFKIDLVYSLCNTDSFFRGCPPSTEKQIVNLNSYFKNVLPADYLSFFKIHNGFAKNSDTGIIQLDNVIPIAEQQQAAISNGEKQVKCGNKPIDPSSIIPFYQCFGRNIFQCFYADWYPGQEMGNVCYSGIDYTISDYNYLKNSSEQLAFASFMDWFIFYLEEIDL